MKKTLLSVVVISLIVWGCSSNDQKQTQNDMLVVSTEKQASIVDQLVAKFGKENQDLAQRGVMQVAALWKESDGTLEDFEQFCVDNFAGDNVAREDLFYKLSENYEVIWGHLHQINVDFSKGVHLDRGPITPVDLMFASYSPYAHLAEDFFKTKLAFVTILNFPFFTLDEKNQLGKEWSRKEWAYARMGDIFTSRVPSAINQESATIATNSESYISEYNIIMDNLLDADGNAIFSGDKRLITHWGLRDELKSHYGNPDGLANQKMIYQVMRRIIAQDIPKQVINNDELKWNPITNDVFDLEGNGVQSTPEPNTRYQHLLNSFLVGQKADQYSPNYPTAIERAFNQGLEMTMQEVEELFVELVSSPLVAEVGKLISSRLGRPLEPFDIWYDGFKPRSGISEE
jgi:PBP1b-binding outer membrane lipoprotein LpoB